MEIPGIRTLHQQADWVEPAYPVVGPPSPDVYDDMVAHYPGSPDVPDQDYRGHIYVDPALFVNDLFEFWRATQQAYSVQRGYSIGYLFGIDYLGGVTVLRGLELQNAANVGRKLPGNWNARSGSAIFLVDVDQPATDQALYAYAMIVAYLRNEGHVANVAKHDDGEWTACPGMVAAQIAAGMGEPEYWVKHGPPPGCAPLPSYLKPPTEPNEQDEDMYPDAYMVVTFDSAPWGAFLVGGGGVVHLDAEMRDWHLANGVHPHESTNDELHASYTRIARGLPV